MKPLEELKKMDFKKLLEELAKAKKDLNKIRFEVTAGQAKNNHLIGKHRKYIARIKTINPSKCEPKKE